MCVIIHLLNNIYVVTSRAVRVVWWGWGGGGGYFTLIWVETCLWDSKSRFQFSVWWPILICFLHYLYHKTQNVFTYTNLHYWLLSVSKTFTLFNSLPNKKCEFFWVFSYLWMAEGLIYRMTPKYLKIIYAWLNTGHFC